MPTKELLEFDSIHEDSIKVLVTPESVTIYNSATDATAWSVSISLFDWEAIKTFVNKQLIK